jgi:hypothetical protein
MHILSTPTRLIICYWQVVIYKTPFYPDLFVAHELLRASCRAQTRVRDRLTRVVAMDCIRALAALRVF